MRFSAWTMVLCAGLFARPLSILGAGESTQAHEETLEEFLKKDLKRHGSHKISVAPAKPTTGIPTGMIMFYGRLVLPPFNIETNDGRLLVNGVQVKPSLIAERHNMAKASSQLTSEQKLLNERLGEIYLAAQKIYSESKDGQKIVDLLSKHKDIFKEISWRKGDEEVCFISPRIRSKECWGFAQVEIPGAKERAAVSARAALESRGYIEQLLREGKFVVFDARGQFGVMNDFRRAVRETMTDRSLTRKQRIERLKKATDDYSLALDIVENFSEEEWSAKD